MSPEELHELAQHSVTNIESAALALGVKRTLAYKNAREKGELCEGVKLIRIGRKWVCPTRPLLAVLGYQEAT
mgnify:CR=1 FL=1